MAVFAGTYIPDGMMLYPPKKEEGLEISSNPQTIPYQSQPGGEVLPVETGKPKSVGSTISDFFSWVKALIVVIVCLNLYKRLK